MTDVVQPDQYRDWGCDNEHIQATMLYEIAVQLERIADELHRHD